MVIFLGDLTFKKNHKGQKMTEIITKLPGRKVLIKGNLMTGIKTRFTESAVFCQLTDI